MREDVQASSHQTQPRKQDVASVRQVRSSRTSRSVLSSEGLEADMERVEGGEAGVELLRGQDKILCYINMQSPGRSWDLDLDGPADPL